MSRRLILLAHPDDEMLCLPHLIGNSPAAFSEDIYLYLTLNSTSGTRLTEANKAISLLNRNIRPSSLFNSDFLIRDGFIWSDFEFDHFNSILNFCKNFDISQILTFAYEGGHQDHDFANVVASLIGQTLGIEVLYFSGYRMLQLLPIFTVSSPLRKLRSIHFSKTEFFKIFLKLALIHRSQIVVWLLLSPGILFRSMFFAVYYSEEKGMTGRNHRKIGSLYEFRKKSSVMEVEKSIFSLITKVRKGVSNG